MAVWNVVMIIWIGWGWLVFLVFPAVALPVVPLIGLDRYDDNMPWSSLALVLLISLVMQALAYVLLERRLRGLGYRKSPGEIIPEDTLKQAQKANSFYWIPVSYWPIVWTVLGSFVAVFAPLFTD